MFVQWYNIRLILMLFLMIPSSTLLRNEKIQSFVNFYNCFFLIYKDAHKKIFVVKYIKSHKKDKF